MDIKKFLKNIFSSEEEVKEPEKIDINLLEAWLKENKSELEKQDQQVSESIKSRVNILISELEQQILILEKVDVSSKKAEEKIKLVVKENLSLYVRYLNNLIERLKDINEEKPLDHLDIIFSDFSKKSELTYQKATFLIGKELGQSREMISRFSKDIKGIVNQNHELYTKLALVKELEKKQKDKINLEDSESKIKAQQEQINFKIEDKKAAVKIINAEIESVKSSESYEKEKERENKQRQEKEDLIKEAGKVRELIDFKNLASIFHVSEKKMGIIKEYNAHFFPSLEVDNGKSLISLLIEANYSMEIQEKLSDLIKKHQKIANFQKKDETIELESEIKKIKHEITLLEEEQAKLEKAKDKLKENKQALINEIKLGLIELNIELELEA
ncbi:MAG: hypothetical protein ABH840_01605 [Nanoarchaeota archaeon]